MLEDGHRGVVFDGGCKGFRRHNLRYFNCISGLDENTRQLNLVF